MKIYFVLFVLFILFFKAICDEKADYEKQVIEELNNIKKGDLLRRQYSYADSSTTLFKRSWNNQAIELRAGHVQCTGGSILQFEIASEMVLNNIHVVGYQSNPLLRLILKDVVHEWDQFRIDLCDGVVIENSSHENILSILQSKNNISCNPSSYSGKVLLITKDYYFSVRDDEEHYRI